ncbi:Maltase-glucoamylase, intestinal [Nymphon striatum]|nr:Maltase-glucoamylase, intestinal [Nymphon striatum]
MRPERSPKRAGGEKTVGGEDFGGGAVAVFVSRHADDKSQRERQKDRVECSIQGVSNEENCQQMGCIWSNSKTPIPSCYISKNYGYKINLSPSKSQEGFEVNLKRIPTKSLYGDDVENIVFRVDYISDQVFRFQFFDPKRNRYRVPVETFEKSFAKPTDSRLYDIQISEKSEVFSFNITRTSTGTILWDTSIGGLTFADQFLQIATKLPTDKIYGFGENTHSKFKHDMNYVTWPIFARDDFPGTGERNLYGVHPFYTCLENDGKSYGVLLMNSNAIDYTMMPAPALTYKTIGGVLDFYIFLGPTPENVIQQYTQLIGRPMIPPYWALGFQLSRWGYESLDHLKEAVERTRKYDIPQDIQYGDIDYMNERMDFTYDKKKFKGFPEYIRNSTKSSDLRFIIILDPALISNVSTYKPYNTGAAKDVFIKWPKKYVPEEIHNLTGGKNFMLGYVWPKGKTAFPDYFKNETKTWWIDTIVDFHNILQFDGLWIDMNEPSNFGTNQPIIWNWPKGVKPWTLKCPNNLYDDPPYKPKAAYVRGQKGRLSQKTLCMIGEQDDGKKRHYDVHSLYGWSQTLPTLIAAQNATKERSMVVTRSTFVSSGRYAGHWLGDNTSEWPFMHQSIVGMLEFNLFGIPYVGADICGFFGNTTNDLCIRWMQLGAFYPFCRNHNGIGYIDQDPGALGKEVAEASRIALNIRYTLLPYLYTLLFEANQHGSTVVRPLFHEFPTDENTYDLDAQFLWGPALMIAPVLEQNVDSLKIYLPKDGWYEYSNSLFHQGPMNTSKDVSGNKMIPLFIRSGHIIPTQDTALNTVKARKNPLSLIIATKGSRSCLGNLFWDDGISIGRTRRCMFSNTLVIDRTNSYKNSVTLKLDKLKILGMTKKPKMVLINNQPVVVNINFNKTLKVVEIRGMNLVLTKNVTKWKIDMNVS